MLSLTDNDSTGPKAHDIGTVELVAKLNLDVTGAAKILLYDVLHVPDILH
jgi:hypothetical protein